MSQQEQEIEQKRGVDYVRQTTLKEYPIHYNRLYEKKNEAEDLRVQQEEIRRNQISARIQRGVEELKRKEQERRLQEWERQRPYREAVQKRRAEEWERERQERERQRIERERQEAERQEQVRLRAEQRERERQEREREYQRQRQEREREYQRRQQEIRDLLRLLEEGDASTHYRVLDIAPCSLQEVKITYRKLALQYHPDRNPAPAAIERFREVTHAYQQLLKIKKRE